jgi:esterase/lipase
MHSTRAKICFILLPGFSPDNVSVLLLKRSLEKRGYAAIAGNFFGDVTVEDFQKLTLRQCQASISAIINRLMPQYDRVLGIGVSLGGALLLEHAKTNNNLEGIVSIGTPFKLKHHWLMRLGEFSMPAWYPLWRYFERFKKLRLLPVGAGPAVVQYLENDFLKNLENVHTPTLFLHSKKDFVADYKALPVFLEKISSVRKQIVFSENGNHIIDHDPEFITDNLVSFFNLP